MNSDFTLQSLPNVYFSSEKPHQKEIL